MNMPFADAVRAETELKRLRLELSLDPILSPVLARCGRPQIVPEDMGDSVERWPVLAIPCPDREAAEFLRRVDWDWHYIPFRDSCRCLLLEFPGGKYYLQPQDPRLEALRAAIRALLPSDCVDDIDLIEVESSGLDRTVRASYQLVGSACCLGTLNLVALNEMLKRLDAIRLLVKALFPDLKELSLHCLGVAKDDITSHHGLSLDGLSLDFDHPANDQMLPLALLSEAGLRWPFQPFGDGCPYYIGLKALIWDEQLLVKGDADAVDACIALLEPLRALVGQLRHIPPIAALEVVEFYVRGRDTVYFPLNAVTVEV